MVAQEVEILKQAFGDREFNGIDVARALNLPSHNGTGSRFKYMLNRDMIYQIKKGRYRFGAQPEAPVKVESAPVVDQSPAPIATPMVRIGDYLMFHERSILLADTVRQEGSDAIRVVLSILEYDTTFRAVRNKVINFIKSRDPKEYAAMRAWLDTMAGSPPTVADDTALELAAELERQLNAARKEIADLKAKLDAIRGAL